MAMKRNPRMAQLNSPQMRAALYFSRKRRLARIAASAVSITPARYWRIYISDSFVPTETSVGVTEIQLRSSAGGIDLTSPAEAAVKAFANSEFNTDFAAEHAFDDVIAAGAGNIWATAFGSHSPAWIGWDFGVGNSENIVEIILTGLNDQNQSPLDGLIQRSDDNIIWTDVWDAGTFTWTSLETKILTRTY